MKRKLVLITAFLGYFFFSLIAAIPLKLLNINPKELSALADGLYIIFYTSVYTGILILIFKKDIKDNLKDFKKNWRNLLDIGFKYWLIGLGIMMVSNIVISNLNNGSIAENEQAVRSMIHTAPYIMIITAGFLAPITEELIFRKLFRELWKSDLFYIIFSGLIFGGLHVLSSFDSYISLLYIIPYGALGIAFAISYVKTKNILVPISMHMIHNLTLVILQIILMKG